MVASQSVVPEPQNDMYPVHSGYAGEYYPDSQYYVGPEMCPAHMCTVHGEYGPVTVPMVSTNSSPPIAMPVQVPPGHVVQQIVDESGTLRHVILSPQHTAGLVPIPSHNPQHYGTGPGNGTNHPPQPFYQGLPPGYGPPHFHSNMPPGHSSHIPLSQSGHSPPPNHSYCKDERAQKQFFKLRKKLQDKQKGDNGVSSPRKELVNGLRRTGTKEKGMNSVGTSEDGEESSSVQDEEDSVHLVADVLSSVQAPKVSELSSRSALLQWAAPLRLSEASSNDSHELDISESDLRYEVLLSDKSKEMKFKSIYSGASLSCRIQDLRPGQEYSVCLQVHLYELQGSASDPVKFTTPPCEPDQPQPPKLISRTKNSLQLRWNIVNDNGSHILYYVLEYDDGKGGEFVELHKSRGRQYTLQKLQPATAYKFRLAALNDVGKSVYSDVVAFSTSDNPPQQPSAPVLKEATVSTLHLQWQRGARDDDFTLQMNDPKTKYQYLSVYNGRDAYYVCENLKHYSEYKFRLRAQNEGGSSPWSEEVMFRTQPERPARPSKPIVKGRIHAHSFRLKWEPPSNTGGAEINKYILEVNSGSGYETVYCGSETEAVCDKLTPGTTYQLRVSCASAGGHSNYSDPCTVTTDAISPGQCAIPRLHGKPKSNSITLRWCEPDYNGGAPVLEYEVDMISSTDSNRTLVHKSKETECTVSDLTPGTEYTFQARAVNRIGPGPWSDSLTATSGAAPPDAPVISSVKCRSPFQVLVEWIEPSCNGAPVVEYKLEMSSKGGGYSEGGDLVEEEGEFVGVFQGVGTSCEVKALSPFTEYFFRVQAVNCAGLSPFSDTVRTVTPAAAPGMVTNVICTEITCTTIGLSWSAPADNGSEITHYCVEIGDRVVRTESSETEHVVESLTPDTLYRIKVQAVNDVGPGQLSSTVKVATLRLPPVAPRLECIAVGHNYVKLKWGEGKNADYTQYCVEMENRRTQEFQCVFKGTAFTCKVNKLQEMTAYRFRICASNDAGIGEWSGVYEFGTNMAPPVGLRPPQVAEVEQRSCVLEWQATRNLSGDAIVYAVQVCRLKDQVYKQVYKGPETRCEVENLEPAAEYYAKVCPIRVTSTSAELPGPFSLPTHFTTFNAEVTHSTKAASTTGISGSGGHRAGTLLNSVWSHVVHRKTISNEQRGLLAAICVVILGIIISVVIMGYISVQ